MYRLVFPESYLKREKTFIKGHPELVERYKKVLRLLELDPFHPSLKLHKLKGRFSDRHAVSITYAYRIVITLVVSEGEIMFIDIGHHDEVY